jgi:hypothetical protein
MGKAGQLTTSVGLPALLREGGGDSTAERRKNRNPVYHAGWGDHESASTWEEPAPAWSEVRL